jgi:hypothetical protein
MRFNKVSIQDRIREFNERYFFLRGLKLELLKTCPQTLYILAEWVYHEWRSYDSSLTKKKLIESFSQRLNDDKIPLTLVALKNGTPVGTVSLKWEDEAELRAISKANPWLGSLQVIYEERKLGLGQELLKIAKSIATSLGYQNLFLYTSNPVNVDWYKKRGACILKTSPFRKHTITIMQIALIHEERKII